MPRKAERFGTALKSQAAKPMSSEQLRFIEAFKWRNPTYNEVLMMCGLYWGERLLESAVKSGEVVVASRFPTRYKLAAARQESAA